MTYTVAAICGTAENFVNDVMGVPPAAKTDDDSSGYVGVGKLLLGEVISGFSKKLEYSFATPSPQQYIRSFLGLSEPNLNLPFEAVIASSTAIADGKVLTVETSVKVKVDMANDGFLVEYPSYFKLVDGSVSYEYIISGAMYPISKTGDEFNGVFRVCLCIFSSGSDFFAFYVEFNGSDGSENFVLKRSTDGVNWSNVITASTEFLSFGASDLSKNMGLGSHIGAACPSGFRLFIGLKAEDSNSYQALYSSSNGQMWDEVVIGRYNGLHWYNDNGTMFLCAVRIGDDGCYGTKICDADGNIQPISWRKASTPWDWSKNRLDAGYLVGMRLPPVGPPQPIQTLDEYVDTLIQSGTIETVVMNRFWSATSVSAQVLGIYQGFGVALVKFRKEPAANGGYKRIVFSVGNNATHTDIRVHYKDYLPHYRDTFIDSGYRINEPFPVGSISSLTGYDTVNNLYAILVKGAVVGDHISMSFFEDPNDIRDWYPPESLQPLPFGPNTEYIETNYNEILSDPKNDVSLDRYHPENDIGSTFVYYWAGSYFYATIAMANLSAGSFGPPWCVLRLEPA
jgi:hypothetical protein